MEFAVADGDVVGEGDGGAGGGVGFDVKVGDDAEGGARAADGEVDVRVGVFRGGNDGAVGEDDFGVDDVVAGGAVLATDSAEAADCVLVVQSVILLGLLRDHLRVRRRRPVVHHRGWPCGHTRGGSH